MSDFIYQVLCYATEKHKGQVDKGGKPYILHPIWVANHVNTDLEKAIALLHDVVEDTDTTVREIETLFGYDVAYGVFHLTKRDNQTRKEYLEDIKSCPDYVITVKIADLTHNSDLSRIPDVTEQDIKRTVRYVQEVKFLTGK